jgi:hypothetical protein
MSHCAALPKQLSMFEEPRGKPPGIFDRKECCLILMRSLTQQQAAGMRSLLRFSFLTNRHASDSYKDAIPFWCPCTQFSVQRLA